MPNDMKRIINHKFLHKINNQWLAISASLLIILTGAISIHSVHAQTVQKSPVMRLSKTDGQSIAVQQEAQRLHNKLTISNSHETKSKVQRYATRTALIKRYRTKPISHIINNDGIRMHVYSHPWKTYLLPTHQRMAYIFSNSDIQNFKSNHTDDLLNNISDINQKSSIPTIIDGSTYAGQQEFFNTYLRPLHDYYWVLPSETNFNKHHSFSKRYLQQFLNYMDKRNLKKNYNKTNVKRISNFRNRYRYLSHYDNYAGARYNLPYFRAEIVNWLNFYRSMNKLTPVTQSWNFDKQAQQSAQEQSDIEDMNWGLTKPRDIVQSYVTDANDVDHNGIAGHRASVLNPISNRIGIGQVRKVNSLFFNYGLGGAGKNRTVYFPYKYISPISDDVNANCWSYRNSDLSNQATVKVMDKTTHHEVSITRPIVIDDTVFYKVNPKDIHTDHIYEITIKSHGMKTVHYQTEPFGLNWI